MLVFGLTDVSLLPFKDVLLQSKFTPPLVFLVYDCVDADHSRNTLDLVFSNITDLHITFPDTCMVKPDVYHPPLLIEMPFIVKTCFKTNELSYFKYACGDYTLLYNILLPSSIPLFMKLLIDLFPEALLKDLIFPLGFPAHYGTIF
jgi:hypothetical protein